jgi:ADP-ribose pyrophosphatase YjhB (NUDIX family)
LSLFYGDDTAALLTITDRRKYLPNSVYGDLVRDAVVCCVDILLVRWNASLAAKEALLVLRTAQPAQGLWWLPGGRLLKGETFFQAAVRKAQQEAGVSATQVRPVQVLGVWNTFFPYSSWDTPESQGTQTVNPIVLVELLDSNLTVQLDAQSAASRWIGLDPAVAEANGEDRYVLQALCRLQAWNSGYAKQPL